MCICCIILCLVLLLCKINYVTAFCHNLFEGMLVTSWKIDGETVETVGDFIFGGSKITSDGDCSHEIKALTPWQESYDQPRQYIKKQRHYFAN